MVKLRQLLIITALSVFFIKQANAQQPTGFLCVFMDGKSEDLRYALSTDGYHFKEVNKGNTILKSTTGGKIIRDPQIVKDRNGIYHLIATNAWAGRSFAIWDSKDLINWKNERLVTVSPETADKTWAPEAIYDEKNNNYVFYWTSSLNKADGTWAIYYATTKDFQKFSDAKVLMRSDDIILDANVVKMNSNKFYMFYRYKNQIWRKEAKQLTGNYRDSSLVINANVEGPYVYKVKGRKWNMIWDYYQANQGKYGMAESTDLSAWTWLTDDKYPYYNKAVEFPVGVRHGAIIPISRSELLGIQSSFTDSSASLIK